MLQKNLQDIIYIAQNNENSYIANKARDVLKELREMIKLNPNDQDLGKSFRKLMTLSLLLFVSFSFCQTLHKVSYYGHNFHGKKTASGEVFNMNDLTCASIYEYKFNTKLKVTNIKNGKSVIVRVNDRGGLKKLKRTLDLSKSAFELIGDIKKGILYVTIEKI